MNIGILLSAGTSSRFISATPKQLHHLAGQSLVSHGWHLLSTTLDEVIIVTNSRCLADIERDHPEAIILVNDINCRIRSIQTAMDFLGARSDSHLLIHDAARPFVQADHVRRLLESAKEYQHSQYYLKLVNGLVRRTESGFESVDRDEYLELVTPQLTEYGIFDYVFRSFIQQANRTVWEVLSVCQELGFTHNLIEGHPQDFRKVTTIHDLDSE